ncbi:MAG: VOC family protein [Planctomycetota bacterium]|jgi:methylmalonyl-CoA/ethylmalonyl-CoA epimerase|nr:VOC family protein [Planctomycetota bacterium]MDP7130643.1 VOC family protein [Planctomycetota bacterium]MDP7248766.1 VOC family protein [Planctomycetota bacterium]
MIQKIHKIAIITDDIEGAVQFYTQKLGLTVVERFENEDDEDYVFLDAGGILLELMPQKTMGQEPGFHHISFEVDSVEDGVQELKDKGVTITKEPFDVGGGTGIALSFFAGPNQMNLQLFHREK